MLRRARLPSHERACAPIHVHIHVHVHICMHTHPHPHAHAHTRAARCLLLRGGCGELDVRARPPPEFGRIASRLQRDHVGGGADAVCRRDSRCHLYQICGQHTANLFADGATSTAHCLHPHGFSRDCAANASRSMALFGRARLFFCKCDVGWNVWLP